MKNSWESKKILAYGKRFSVFTSIMLVLLFAFSCSNLIMNDGGSLIIAVPGARAASASSYTIELTGSNGTTQRKTVTGGTTAQFDDLAPDTYTIVVEGIDTNNKVVLGGSSSATVVAGATASTTVKLVEGVSDYAGLVDAIAAGGIVKILKSIDVENTLSPQANNPVTILPAYQNVTLKNTGSGYLFEVKSGNLTIGGGEHTITLNGNQVAKEIIKMSSGTVTLASNGIIRNAASTGVSVNGGIFNMTGGTIMNNNTTSSMGGGAVFLQGATFTMSGGILKDNTSSETGGAIAMLSGTCTITGGSITGNTAQNYGGGVCVSGGTFDLSGGSISNNSATYGSGVSVNQGSFKMSGSAVVAPDNDVYLLSGKMITVAGTLSGATPVATITPNSYTAGTLVMSVENNVVLADEVSKFAVTPNPDGSSQWFIDTSGKLQEGAYVSDFASLENAISAGGTVYITKAITMERTLDINKEVTLLSTTQSVVLTGLNPGNLFTVSNGGDFTIGDADHSITLDGNKKSSQIISVDDGGIVTLANGTITNANASGVYINGGTFNMTGGSITGNTATNGGGVYVDGTFDMSGGSIEDNTATNGGGGVYVNTGATFTMSGSAIVNEDNNDVYLSANTTISVSDDLSGDIVARITPYRYEVGLSLLSNAPMSSSIHEKFTVTSDSIGQKYQIVSGGTLGKLM